MSAPKRRTFLLHSIAAPGILAAAGLAQAADEASKVPVKETDPYPKSMGFRVKTANVDKAKFPRHSAEQKCSSCQLYSGKDGDALGPCSFFKRMVPPDGWCRNFKPRKAA